VSVCLDSWVNVASERRLTGDPEAFGQFYIGPANPVIG
jgi:hypothetical protein